MGTGAPASSVDALKGVANDDGGGPSGRNLHVNDGSAAGKHLRILNRRISLGPLINQVAAPAGHVNTRQARGIGEHQRIVID